MDSTPVLDPLPDGLRALDTWLRGQARAHREFRLHNQMLPLLVTLAGDVAWPNGFDQQALGRLREGTAELRSRARAVDSRRALLVDTVGGIHSDADTLLDVAAVPTTPVTGPALREAVVAALAWRHVQHAGALDGGPPVYYPEVRERALRCARWLGLAQVVAGSTVSPAELVAMLDVEHGALPPDAHYAVPPLPWGKAGREYRIEIEPPTAGGWRPGDGALDVLAVLVSAQDPPAAVLSRHRGLAVGAGGEGRRPVEAVPLDVLELCLFMAWRFCYTVGLTGEVVRVR